MQDLELEAFLDGDYRRVVRAVAAVCGDRHRAEDAVQDALVDVWEKRRTVHDLTGWITTAALNRSHSRWRTHAAERRAFTRLFERTASSPVTEVDGSFDAHVAEAMRALPRAQREVVALHYLLDMSVADIAARLDVVDGTVKTHLHRGRTALRAALGDTADYEEPDHVRS